MIALNKDQWLSQMPELIHNLKVKYNFYYSGYYTTINKDILEVVKAKQEKNKHKLVLYNYNNRFFFVVYRKGSPDIYYTNEYKKDEKNNRISYFTRKFRRAYKKAEAEYEQEKLRKDIDNRIVQ